MVGNALFAASVICLGLLLYVMSACRFLIPYRSFLVEKYGGVMALYVAALFLNLFAATYTIARKVLLKDTGKKLAHLEKQLRTGSISEELSQRLKEE